MKQFTVNKTLRQGVLEEKSGEHSWYPTVKISVSCVCVLGAVLSVCLCVRGWFTQEDEYLSGFLNWIPLLIFLLQSLPLSYHSSAVTLIYLLYIHSSTERSSGDSPVPSVPSQKCILSPAYLWILNLLSSSCSSVCLLHGSIWKKKKKSSGGRSKAPLHRWKQPIAWPQTGGRWCQPAAWRNWTPPFPAGEEEERRHQVIRSEHFIL